MKPQFKWVVMMLILSLQIHAQDKNVYNKNFEADKSTIMVINVNDSSIIIEPSNDGKVHVDYNSQFDGYSKKEIKKEVERITVEAVKFENTITLNASYLKGDRAFYTYNGTGSLVLKDDFFSNNSNVNDTIVRKSKDSLLKEIKVKSIRTDLSFNKNRFKINENGKMKNLTKANFKVSRSKFRILVPPYVKLIITGKESKLYFNQTTINELNLNLKKGTLNADKLINNKNKVTLDNVILSTAYLLGGDYELKNISKGKIVALNTVTINSEFSKVEIGEIQKGVKITDFNSEYKLYNWSDDFERFDFFSEYSKIHHFDPKNDFSFLFFGNNTISYTGNYKIEMQPTRNGEKFKMMERKPKGNEPFSGHINFDIIHGIIYSHKDKTTTIINNH